MKRRRAGKDFTKVTTDEIVANIAALSPEERAERDALLKRNAKGWAEGAILSDGSVVGQVVEPPVDAPAALEPREAAIKTRCDLRKTLKEHGITAKVMVGASDSRQNCTTLIAVIAAPDEYAVAEPIVIKLATSALAKLQPAYQKFMVRPAADAPKQGRVWK